VYYCLLYCCHLRISRQVPVALVLGGHSVSIISCLSLCSGMPDITHSVKHYKHHKTLQLSWNITNIVLPHVSPLTHQLKIISIRQLACGRRYIFLFCEGSPSNPFEEFLFYFLFAFNAEKTVVSLLYFKTGDWRRRFWPVIVVVEIPVERKASLENRWQYKGYDGRQNPTCDCVVRTARHDGTQKGGTYICVTGTLRDIDTLDHC
jgi:hypothetical protein